MQNDWRDLIKPKTVEFDEKEVTPSYGKFSAEPLERGYGITVGNALRRILLSTLPGYAITAVRIKNVLHEFSTLAGVKEDVTDVVLNLKEVRLRLHEGEHLTASLKARGKASKVALIAVARKLLVLANALLRTGTRYQPRTNSVCLENA